MDEKYIAKTIALPRETADLVVKMQTELHKRLGFKPSHSETIATAVTRWIAEEM